MMETIKLIGAIITLIGSIFILLGSIGLVRMPDFYNRVQTGTKASTLGTMLSLLGVGIIHLDWAGKIIILILFVLMTNPLSSHVLARAAHFTNVRMTRRTVVDKLTKKRFKLKKDN